MLTRVEPNEKEKKFRVDGKQLKNNQIVRYLNVSDRDYEIFEDSIKETVMAQIEHYFKPRKIC